ncbi:MAG: hypothetical protein L0Z53_21145 [Acidobacteriales bacterium]|nr:hypothetical protein [Terriglobales bacterium]
MDRYLVLCAWWIVLASAAWAQSPRVTRTEFESAPEERPTGNIRGNSAGAKANLGAVLAQEERRFPSALFIAIDANGDGAIDKRELARAVAQIKKLDKDGDGNILLWEIAGEGGTYRDFNLQYSAGELNEYQHGVFTYDKNGDGKLVPGELPAGVGPLFMLADLNRDRGVDRKELAIALQNVTRSEGGSQSAEGGSAVDKPDRYVEKTFRQQDRNADGTLTMDELPLLALPIVNQADRNNDGMLDANELQAVVRKMSGKK